MSGLAEYILKQYSTGAYKGLGDIEFVEEQKRVPMNIKKPDFVGSEEEVDCNLNITLKIIELQQKIEKISTLDLLDQIQARNNFYKERNNLLKEIDLISSKTEKAQMKKNLNKVTAKVTIN